MLNSFRRKKTTRGAASSKERGEHLAKLTKAKAESKIKKEEEEEPESSDSDDSDDSEYEEILISNLRGKKPKPESVKEPIPEPEEKFDPIPKAEVPARKPVERKPAAKPQAGPRGRSKKIVIKKYYQRREPKQDLKVVPEEPKPVLKRQKEYDMFGEVRTDDLAKFYMRKKLLNW